MIQRPWSVCFQGGKVWFTAQGAKSIGRLDPATGKTEWIMGTGQDFTHLIRVMPDGQTIFVSNAHSASVSIIENREVPPDPTHPAPPGPAQRDWFVTTIPTLIWPFAHPTRARLTASSALWTFHPSFSSRWIQCTLLWREI